MTLSTPSGFWSYAHSDDDATDGHVRRLATQVANAFRLLTGTDLDLFFDRDSLKWGDEWKDKIDSSIHGTTFFIPIITPSYLASEACREEFLSFWKKSSESGLGELLLPIIYAPVEFDVSSDDEIIAIVSRVQSEIWNEIRLEEESSSIYKKSLNGLANRLKEIAARVDTKPEMTLSGSLVAKLEDNRPVTDDLDEPGLLERVADVELILPEWQNTIVSLSTGMSEIEAATDAAQPALDKAKKSDKMAARIIALKEASKLLEQPTLRFRESAKKYQEQSISLDRGITALAEITAMSNDDSDRNSAVELAETISGMHDVVEGVMNESAELLNVLRDVGKLSRDMREPTKNISEGFRIIKDTQVIFKDWIKVLLEVGTIPDQESEVLA